MSLIIIISFYYLIKPFARHCTALESFSYAANHSKIIKFT